MLSDRSFKHVQHEVLCCTANSEDADNVFCPQILFLCSVIPLFMFLSYQVQHIRPQHTCLHINIIYFCLEARQSLCPESINMLWDSGIAVPVIPCMHYHKAVLRLNSCRSKLLTFKLSVAHRMTLETSIPSYLPITFSWCGEHSAPYERQMGR